jgi:small GTP-binding protein
MTVNKKVCIIGAFAAGKTSLVRRYVLDQFSPEYRATLGVNITKFSDEIALPDGETVPVNQILWDIEGGQDGEALLETYLRGASGALVVGDIGRRDVLDSMASHARRFSELLPGRPMVFALNKVDLVRDPSARPDPTSLRKEFGGLTLFTSAATGEAVRELFHSLAERILEVGA